MPSAQENNDRSPELSPDVKRAIQNAMFPGTDAFDPGTPEPSADLSKITDIESAWQEALKAVGGDASLNSNADQTDQNDWSKLPVADDSQPAQPLVEQPAQAEPQEFRSLHDMAPPEDAPESPAPSWLQQPAEKPTSNNGSYDRSKLLHPLPQPPALSIVGEASKATGLNPGISQFDWSKLPAAEPPTNTSGNQEWSLHEIAPLDEVDETPAPFPASTSLKPLAQAIQDTRDKRQLTQPTSHGVSPLPDHQVPQASPDGLAEWRQRDEELAHKEDIHDFEILLEEAQGFQDANGGKLLTLKEWKTKYNLTDKKKVNPFPEVDKDIDNWWANRLFQIGIPPDHRLADQFRGIFGDKVLRKVSRSLIWNITDPKKGMRARGTFPPDWEDLLIDWKEYTPDGRLKNIETAAVELGHRIDGVQVFGLHLTDFFGGMAIGWTSRTLAKAGLIAATGGVGYGGAILAGGVSGAITGAAREYIKQVRENIKEAPATPGLEQRKLNLKEKFRVKDKRKLIVATGKGALMGAVGGFAGSYVLEHGGEWLDNFRHLGENNPSGSGVTVIPDHTPTPTATPIPTETPIPSSPPDLGQHLPLPDQPIIEGLLHQNIQVEPGSSFWQSFNIPQEYFPSGTPWVNSVNGVTQSDVIKDMVGKFAAANGHNLSQIPPGPFSLNSLGLTPEQMEIINAAAHTTNVEDYRINVMPGFQSILEKVK